MTFRFVTPALALIVALGASTAEAHSPRAHAPNPMAALDALDMPGLAPARALMHEMLNDEGLSRGHPHNRIIIVTEPEIPTRRVLPFFSFRWLGGPNLRHQDSPRCETLYSPFGGRIETCPAPLGRSLTPHSGDLLEDLQRRLDRY